MGQIKIKDELPFGRNLAEYKQMFMLSEENLKSNILDIGSGPSSFNVEMKQNGHLSIVSVDPIYAFSAHELKECVDEASSIISSDVTERQDIYSWGPQTHPSLDSLFSTRHAAMNNFLADFENNASSYLISTVLSLPFPDNFFDLALSSHFLILYSEQLGIHFHLEAIRELCRVAQEIRIYPQCSMSGEMPNSIITAMRKVALASSKKSEIVHVPHEFVKGSNVMLRFFVEQ